VNEYLKNLGLFLCYGWYWVAFLVVGPVLWAAVVLAKLADIVDRRESEE